MPIGQITFKIQRECGEQLDEAGRATQTARLTYQADSTDPANDNEFSMRADYAAPKAGMGHPFIPGLTAREVTCRKVNRVLYEFDVTFSGAGRNGQAPWEEPPVIETDFAISEEPYDRDYEGKPIQFITGEIPEPLPKDTVYDLIIRCSRNLQWVDRRKMARYAGRTNSDVFLDEFQPGTCKITEPPKSRSATWNNKTYYQCTMGVTVRHGVPGFYEDYQAWHKRVLAQGYLVRTYPPAVDGINQDKDKTIIIHALDATGAKATKPVLHEKKEGFMLPRDSSTGLQDPRKAEWYFFKPRLEPLPFSELQISQ